MMLAILLLLPAILLIWASFRLPRSARHSSIVLIIVGASLLGLSSLDFLITIFTALHYSSEDLAKYSVYANSVVRLLRYIGMLFLAAGLIRLSGERPHVSKST